MQLDTQLNTAAFIVFGLFLRLLGATSSSDNEILRTTALVKYVQRLRESVFFRD